MRSAIRSSLITSPAEAFSLRRGGRAAHTGKREARGTISNSRDGGTFYAERLRRGEFLREAVAIVSEK